MSLSRSTLLKSEVGGNTRTGFFSALHVATCVSYSGLDLFSDLAETKCCLSDCIILSLSHVFLLLQRVHLNRQLKPVVFFFFCFHKRLLMAERRKLATGILFEREKKNSPYMTQRKHAQKNIILMVCLNMMFSLFFKNVQSGRYIQLCSQVWARSVKLHISFQVKAIRGHWQVRGGYCVFHKLVRSLLKHSAWLHTAFCPAVVCIVTCAAGSAESE